MSDNSPAMDPAPEFTDPAYGLARIAPVLGKPDPDQSLPLPRDIARGQPPATLLGTKALRCLMLLARHVGLEGGVIYSTPASVLRDMFNINNDMELRKAFMDLRGRTWNWPGLSEQDGWVAPISAIRWVDGTIEWEVSSMFIRELGLDPKNPDPKGLPRSYFEETWLEIHRFKSLYSLRIYEYVRSHQHNETGKAKTPAIPVEALREILGVDDAAYRLPPLKPGGKRRNHGGLWDYCIRGALKEVEMATEETIPTATSRRHTLPGMKIECFRSGRGENTLCWFEITNAEELLKRDQQLELTENVPVVKRRVGPLPVASDDPLPELAARCIKAVKGLPKEARDNLVSQLGGRNLPAKVTATTPGLIVKAYAGALKGLGIELPES